METILTDTIKSSMRILSKSAVIEQDINNSIAACKLDLQLAGVVNINENDALIIRAVAKSVLLKSAATNNPFASGSKINVLLDCLANTLPVWSYCMITSLISALSSACASILS